MSTFLKFVNIYKYFDFIYILFLFSFIIFIINLILNKIKINNHIKLINSLKIGDEILINGGIICKIYKFLDNNYVLLIINDNQKILVEKNYIKYKLSKKILNNLNNI